MIWRPSKGASTRCLRSVLDGPAAVLEGAGGWLADQGISPKRLNRHGASWRIAWHHADSLRLAGIMYADPGPCVARKKALFREPR